MFISAQKSNNRFIIS